ncbi:hypothetical protein [Nonomuraea salmonea]|uniref:hypothetical protein n=1 Tax=Nonomuraea salmonea TaxID=46181 RepID=UPI0031EC5922
MRARTMIAAMSAAAIIMPACVQAVAHAGVAAPHDQCAARQPVPEGDAQRPSG